MSGESCMGGESCMWGECCMGGNRIVCNRTKKAEGRCQICTCLLPYTKSYDFLTLQKAMDKTLSIAFYARITTGKKSNQTDGSLHCCLQSITQFPDEITKAHKIRHTLYNVSSVWIVQRSLSSEVDLIYKSPYLPLLHYNAATISQPTAFVNILAAAMRREIK